VVDLAQILTDLYDESAQLDRLVAGLAPDDWSLQTPAPGWTIAHQIAHLTWTDRVAKLAATDPDSFAEVLADVAEAPDGFVDAAANAGLAEPADLLELWRASRADLAAALTAAPPEARLPWFGVTMSPASMATGRMMETWAHGEDIAETVGIVRVPTRRLRHVVYLGVRSMGHGFAAHGRPVPEVPVYAELTGPDGTTWAYGPPDAENRLVGPAIDFCLLVTQRRHPEDLSLTATGPVAREWLAVAQAFAGPPGPGRPAKATG
jgi:uncharacterized protein (TIGR03084 family)